jgi:hypothetical protein
VHHVVLDAAATAAAEASPCPADVNGDRAVDLGDLLEWLETDGFAVDREALAPDLTSIIATWGPC